MGFKKQYLFIFQLMKKKKPLCTQWGKWDVDKT